jgi:hypothetical protein
MKKILVLAVAFFLSVGLAGTVFADSIAMMTEENSTAQYDLSSTGVGMNNWTVDGINRLVEQSFWYRVGNTAQQRVNTLNLVSWSLLPSNYLVVNYSDPSSRFTLQLSYTLTGSDTGSGISDLGETVKVKNISGAPLDFHLYEYVDIDLLGLAHPIDSELTLKGTPVNTANQSNNVVSLAETVLTPSATHYEAGYSPQLLSNLSSGLVYNLNDTAYASNGDLAWAFQWDVALGTSASNRSFTLSKDKRLGIVPEPSTFVLLGFGAFGLLAYAWRRRN